MKVLYATYRYDPLDPDLGSSRDNERFKAISRAGFHVRIVGPVTDRLPLFERMEQFLGRIYKKVTGKSFLKFPLTTAWRSSVMLSQAVRDWKPDIIFSVFPVFFVFYSGNAPVVCELDTTFLGQEAEWPIYGRLPLALSVWEEKKAFSKAAKVLTNSQWSKNILIDKYGLQGECVEIFPEFACIPEDVVVTNIDVVKEKRLEFPLRILLVGRIYKRKGIDIAFEVIRLLNKQGVPSVLTVCGLGEKFDELPPFTNFVGPYRKSDPEQLQTYISWYRWAHLLLHPARFEAAGVVPNEAAAFATPTITNDTGGLGTTVKHGESGIVLPRGSAPEVYVKVIKELVAQPDQYYELCRKTKQRYERELNSNVAGKRLARILSEVVNEHRFMSRK